MNNRYQKAVAYFNEEIGNVNIANAYTEKYAEELIFCFEHKKEIIDFDFWTRYEELMGEKLSYDEYLAIDSSFDLDPHDITPEDKETLEGWLAGWRETLHHYRENQNVKSEEYYISQYKALVERAIKKADAQYDVDGIPKDKRDYGEAVAEEEIHATHDEVVGFYLGNHFDNPLKEWLHNIEGLELSEQDKEVTKTLEKFMAAITSAKGTQPLADKVAVAEMKSTSGGGKGPTLEGPQL